MSGAPADAAAAVSIADRLRCLNRKERYWLIRGCLGDPPLDAGFRQELAAVLANAIANNPGRGAPISPIPADAFWAIDYHLDWLAPALLAHKHGFPLLDWPPQAIAEGSYHGHHQDIDLLVAFDNEVILVEAKADSAWKNDQILPKIHRFIGMAEDGCVTGAAPGVVPVRLHLALMSPNPPKSLDTTKWPAWTKYGGRPIWLPLAMDEGLRRIERCTGNAVPSISGTSYRITLPRQRGPKR